MAVRGQHSTCPPPPIPACRPTMFCFTKRLPDTHAHDHACTHTYAHTHTCTHIRTRTREKARDGFPASKDEIFLTDGASAGTDDSHKNRDCIDF